MVRQLRNQYILPLNKLKGKGKKQDLVGQKHHQTNFANKLR